MKIHTTTIEYNKILLLGSLYIDTNAILCKEYQSNKINNAIII